MSVSDEFGGNRFNIPEMAFQSLKHRWLNFMFFLAKKLFAGSVKQFGVLHYFHLECDCEKYPRAYWEKLFDIKLWIPTMYWKENFDEMDFAHTDNQHNQCIISLRERAYLSYTSYCEWDALCSFHIFANRIQCHHLHSCISISCIILTTRSSCVSMSKTFS